MKALMTGNEAIARGAWEAGVLLGAGYPGTPSTEILENLVKYDNVYAEWSTNEKVGLEVAIGASVAGARAMATMKHVGVNVAADPLFTAGYTGVNGGLVVIDAEDPSLHSSQNEQDNRWMAKGAMLAMIEPSDSQECKDFMKEAFTVSETYDVPLFFRVTTRVCHSKSLVELGDRVEKNIIPYEKNAKFDMIPANAKKRRLFIEDRTKALKAYANKTPLNRVELGQDTSLGIITSGISYQYVKELFGDTYPILKLGFTYPFPDELVTQFAATVDAVLVVEELDPFVETHVRALGIQCIGKDKIPNHFELNPDILREVLLGEKREIIDNSKEQIAMRPPTFCAGCPHRGFFYSLSKLARKYNAIVTSDIGCYSLSTMQPLAIKDTGLCMGAGFSMAHGAQLIFNKAGEGRRVVGVMGDSTFFHSGMTSLINSVYNGDNALYVILDNRITAMTGHQNNPGTGYTLQGRPATEAKIDEVVKALGVKHVLTVNPLQLKEMEEALKWGFEQEEPAVIITRWPCVLKQFTQEDIKEFNLKKEFNVVNHDLCIGCKACIRTGCPALSFNPNIKKTSIDKNQCVACDVCAQVCPKKAIGRGA